MDALVLTGRVVPGHDRADAIARAASLFGLDGEQFTSRVVARTPVTIRETPDASEIQRLRIHLLECGLDAEVASSDGIKWQVESENSTRGPVPLAYLDAEFRLGRLGATQRVKRSTDSTWMSIANATAGDTATHVRLARPADVAPPPIAPPPIPMASTAAPPPPPLRQSGPPPAYRQGAEPPPLPNPGRARVVVTADSARLGTTSLDRIEAMKIFVGPNYEYFAKKWQQNGGMALNWAAFFLGPVWLMYRKMYVFTALYLGVIIADIVIEALLNVNDAGSNVITLFIGIIFAWNANTFYRRQFERKLFAASQHPSPDGAKFELARQGGTSVAAAVVFAFALIALALGGAFLAERYG